MVKWLYGWLAILCLVIGGWLANALFPGSTMAGYLAGITATFVAYVCFVAAVVERMKEEVP